MTTRAMFPLGDVAVPGQPVPLQVFEPRYLIMVDRIMAGDRTFGSCLIERGSEVGGGDRRLDIGTLVEIVNTRRLHDGRLIVEGVGRSRIRIERWHPDDPYPIADVSDFPDPAPLPAEIERVDVVRGRLVETVSEVLTRRGMTLPDGWLGELSDDASTASFQLCAKCPSGPFDRYRLLSSPTVGLRLALLSELIDDLLVAGYPPSDDG